MAVLCKIDDLEAEYKFTDVGKRRCSVILKSPNRKLSVERVSAGKGLINMFQTVAQSSGHIQRVWNFDPIIAKDAESQYALNDYGSGGEVLEVSLEGAGKLFPCTGFVVGDLTGIITAPAVHAKMMGTDVWAFMMYFDAGIKNTDRIKLEKSSLTVGHGSTTVSAELSSDSADQRKLIVKLKANGGDFKTSRVLLKRITSGHLLVEQIAEMGKDEGSEKEFQWTPVSRAGSELLWVFTKGHLFSRHGPVKDMVEQLGGKVNRSIFADGFYGRQMDDFILTDSEGTRFKIELIGERHFGSHEIDSTMMKYVRPDSDRAPAKKRTKNVERLSRSVEVQNPVETEIALTKFCMKCGSKIDKSAKFCSNCGQPQPE